jgi:lactoylglutathione lyase
MSAEFSSVSSPVAVAQRLEDLPSVSVETFAEEYRENLAASTHCTGLSHTMLRVSNIVKSLQFYQSMLGMTLMHVIHMEKEKFSLYFLGYPALNQPIPHDATERAQFVWGLQGLVELCYMWNSPEKQYEFKSGNEREHRGFGHIAVSVNEFESALHRFQTNNIKFILPWDNTKSLKLAIIKDPDGYWIEILPKSRVKDSSSVQHSCGCGIAH